MTLQEFDVLAARLPYQPKGIFYSELYLFIQHCLTEQVALVIESGVHRGMSTRVLGAVFPGSVISIDQDFQIDPPAGVRFVRGDGQTVIPKLLQQRADQRIGVLIDGPKGRRARALKDVCFTHPSVRVVAIHSGGARGHGESLHSHDPAYQAYRSLDRFVSAPFRAAYPKGPGLSLWVAA